MSDPIIPTAEQLAESRRTHWHQDGRALLTAEALLPWIERSGLLLFAPRGQQFPAPAPTLVEATLGAANTSPTVGERETARSLVQRLVAEGSVLPLNLLGAPGTTADEPDFIVSATVFPYLFTLRGDKAWKQLPSASGPFKVSPLGVNTYTLLSEGGPRTASDLVNELGKGLTEAAVLRALSELWQHLRVFPVGQADGSVLWELASARFTKAIKSGANAGQPSALSALITLYLGQAVLATEDDVEIFLSPLAPRSRVRDVAHALSAAREVDTVVVEGKHCLHVRGDLPAFAPAPEEAAALTQPEVPEVEGEGRIKKFATFKRKPSPPAGGRSFSSDRERRPFAAKRDGARPGATPPMKKPAFDRPWDEKRTPRAARPEASVSGDTAVPEFQDLDLDAGAEAPQRPAQPAFRGNRPKKPFAAGKPAFGGRGAGKLFFGDRAGRKPSFGDPPRPEGTGRPPFRRDREGDASRGGERPAYSRPRESSAGKFAPRERPPYRGDRDSAGPKRPFVNRGFVGSSGPAGTERPGDRRSPGKKFGPPAGDRPFRPRREESGGERPARREQTGRPPRREFGGAKRLGGSGGGPTRSFGPASGDSRQARGPRPDGGGAGASPKRFGTGAGGPKRTYASRPPTGGADRPAGKRPFAGGADRGQKADGPFDKFKAGNKPWGKRPPARKIKPEEDIA